MFVNITAKMPKPTVPYQYRIINHDLDGMHFYWNNIWHNWGNNQAYALLETFKITGDSTLFYSVNAWDYTLIPFLIENTNIYNYCFPIGKSIINVVPLPTLLATLIVP